MAYDAFLSYSHLADAELAAALQSSLQRFSRHWLQRRPFLRVVRDEVTFGAGDELDDVITQALDESGSLVVLLSPQAAQSDWVNLEVQHWLNRHGSDRLILVVTEWVVDSAPGADPADLGDFRWDGTDVPPALRGVFSEPLAVDLRWATSPSDWSLDNERWRESVAEIAAGIKQQDKDEFFGDVATMRTRARILTGTVLLGVGILATAIAITIPSWYFASRDADQSRSEQEIAQAEAEAAETRQAEAQDAAKAAEAATERISPENQTAAFIDWLTARLIETDPSTTAEDVNITILGTDNLNGDQLLDFFIFNQTPGWCGSGGCEMGVYLSQGTAEYENVLNLWQHSNPRSREGPVAEFRDVVAMEHDVAGEPVWSVYRWDGGAYAFSHYEYCDGILYEYCNPLTIDALDESPPFALPPDTCLLTAPENEAATASCGEQGETSLLGVVAGGDWYLVEIRHSEAAQYVGFIKASDLEPWL